MGWKPRLSTRLRVVQMKIIFSRKGFDSVSGRVPSPILPDGRLLSLPIPDKGSSIRYDDLLAYRSMMGVSP